MRNIELFDIYTARVFGKLYENFPLKCDLINEDIALSKRVDDISIPKEELIARDTIAWLIESNYIRCERVSSAHFGGCVLSAKGLELLKVVPESISSKVSFGDKIISLLKDGLNDKAKEIVNNILSYGLKYGL